MFVKVINQRDNSIQVFEIMGYSTILKGGNNKVVQIFFKNGKNSRESMTYTGGESLKIFFMNDNGKTIDKI